MFKIFSDIANVVHNKNTYWSLLFLKPNHKLWRFRNVALKKNYLPHKHTHTHNQVYFKYFL